jgi:hypothetical protein
MRNETHCCTSKLISGGATSNLTVDDDLHCLESSITGRCLGRSQRPVPRRRQLQALVRPRWCETTG